MEIPRTSVWIHANRGGFGKHEKPDPVWDTCGRYRRRKSNINKNRTHPWNRGQERQTKQNLTPNLDTCGRHSRQTGEKKQNPQRGRVVPPESGSRVCHIQKGCANTGSQQYMEMASERLKILNTGKEPAWIKEWFPPDQFITCDEVYYQFRISLLQYG